MRVDGAPRVEATAAEVGRRQQRRLRLPVHGAPRVEAAARRRGPRRCRREASLRRRRRRGPARRRLRRTAPLLRRWAAPRLLLRRIAARRRGRVALLRRRGRVALPPVRRPRPLPRRLAVDVGAVAARPLDHRDRLEVDALEEPHLDPVLDELDEALAVLEVGVVQRADRREDLSGEARREDVVLALVLAPAADRVDDVDAGQSAVRRRRLHKLLDLVNSQLVLIARRETGFCHRSHLGLAHGLAALELGQRGERLVECLQLGGRHFCTDSIGFAPRRRRTCTDSKDFNRGDGVRRLDLFWCCWMDAEPLARTRAHGARSVAVRGLTAA